MVLLQKLFLVAVYEMQSVLEWQMRLLKGYDLQNAGPLIVTQLVIRHWLVFQELRLQVFVSGLQVHCKYLPSTLPVDLHFFS